MKRKRVHNLIVIVLFFLSNFLGAQSTWSEWQKGTIYLSSGKVLNGNVIYEEGLEVLQFMNNSGNVESYSAFVVDSFQLIYKKRDKQYTRFYWDRGFENQKDMPDFFQIVYNGKLKLLNKERKVIVTDDFNSMPLSYSVNPLGNRFPIYYETTVYNYFYFDENGSIEFVKDLKKYFKEKYPMYKVDIKNIFKTSNNELKNTILLLKFLEENIILSNN